MCVDDYLANLKRRGQRALADRLEAELSILMRLGFAADELTIRVKDAQGEQEGVTVPQAVPLTMGAGAN